MAAWLPSDAATPLACWIDPADDATVSTSGGRILQILDKSSNGNNFSTTSIGLLPTTQNGNVAVAGSSTGSSTEVLKRIGSGLNSVTAAANTYACAAGCTAPGSVVNAGFSVLNASGRVYGWVYDGSLSALRWRHGGTTGGSSNISSAVTVQTHSGTSLIGYANGSQDLSASSASDFTSGSSEHQIGGQSNAPWGFNGWVGDCLIYSGVLSQTDREKLEGYLAHKWGLAGSLPGGHPYKNAPPSRGLPPVSRLLNLQPFLAR